MGKERRVRRSEFPKGMYGFGDDRPLRFSQSSIPLDHYHGVDTSGLSEDQRAEMANEMALKALTGGNRRKQDKALQDLIRTFNPDDLRKFLPSGIPALFEPGREGELETYRADCDVQEKEARDSNSRLVSDKISREVADQGQKKAILIGVTVGLLACSGACGYAAWLAEHFK